VPFFRARPFLAPLCPLPEFYADDDSMTCFSVSPARANRPMLMLTVLPSSQDQNISNCVSEYVKQDKNMPNVFRDKKTPGKLAVKLFHIFTKFTAQSTIHINTF